MGRRPKRNSFAGLDKGGEEHSLVHFFEEIRIGAAGRNRSVVKSFYAAKAPNRNTITSNDVGREGTRPVFICRGNGDEARAAMYLSLSLAHRRAVQREGGG